MSSKAIRCHITPGRIRLRLLERLPESELQAIAQHLLAIPTTSSVHFSHLTGSIVLEHTEGTDDHYLDEISKRAGIIWTDYAELLPFATPEDVIDLKTALNRLDTRIRTLTAGELTLQAAGACVLATLGFLQFGRGQGLPAGLTLILNAAKFMRSSTRKN